MASPTEHKDKAVPDDKQGVMHHTVSTDHGQTLDPEVTAARARRLLLKTDLVVTPLAVLSMTLAFLDKVSSTASSSPKMKPEDLVESTLS